MTDLIGGELTSEEETKSRMARNLKENSGNTKLNVRKLCCDIEAGRWNETDKRSPDSESYSSATSSESLDAEEAQRQIEKGKLSAKAP